MSQEVEDLLESEVNKIYGRCRCCLEPAFVKNMWTEYSWEGAQEIYGEMLMETFSIAWDSAPDAQEQICEACVRRLRDAHTFKREVLTSEQLLKEGVLDSESESVKQEILSDLDQYENTTEDALEDPEGNEEENNQDTFCEEEFKTEEVDVEYEEVEYLDEDVTPETDQSGKEPKGSSGETLKQPKRGKWSGRKRTHGLNIRNYRNYSEDALRQSMEKAMSSDMSISKVASIYGVPRKTLTARIYNAKHAPKPDSPQEIERQLNQERHFKFVLEIKKVLSFTNASPFKIKAGRYHCAYCYTTLHSFDSPVTLRAHTHDHKDERLDRLDQILRPQFLNEILRVDIEMLECVICDIPIPSWNDMFAHLNDTHDIELDQAYTKLIPYKLKGQTVFCALCNEEFPGFQYLDTHMNAHYFNYMCSDCGDTFVTENRLKRHVLTHNTGRYPCKHCGKVFSLEKYKTKHEGIVHKDFKMFKCIDCDESFHTEHDRHLHMVANHKERVQLFTCEVCGKTYDWKPYYMAHIRKVHIKLKKYVCKYCQKGFVTKHYKDMHELRHTGQGKHVCVFCKKNYVTLPELRKHCKKHMKEIRKIDGKDFDFTQLGDNVVVVKGS